MYVPSASSSPSAPSIELEAQNKPYFVATFNSSFTRHFLYCFVESTEASHTKMTGLPLAQTLALTNRTATLELPGATQLGEITRPLLRVSCRMHVDRIQIHKEDVVAHAIFLY
jgi:hypothetical protein